MSQGQAGQSLVSTGPAAGEGHILPVLVTCSDPGPAPLCFSCHGGLGACFPVWVEEVLSNALEAQDPLGAR